MINLMPDNAKKQLRAARVNVLLVRYMGIIFLAFLFLVFILFGSHLLLNQTKASSQQLIDANDTKAEVYQATKTQVDALSAQLSEAKAILDVEVLYSKVLINFAQQMPAGTIIDKLSLESSSFSGTPLTLKVYAKSTDDAVALRDRFQTSQFFKDVSFQTITDNSGGIEGYPISATMTLTLDRKITQ
jgi:Tfp pilus assembly protein PilN